MRPVGSDDSSTGRAHSWSEAPPLSNEVRLKGTLVESSFSSGQGIYARDPGFELEEWWSLSVERLRAIFSRADADADGRVSFGEVYVALSRYGLGAAPPAWSAGARGPESKFEPPSPRARSLDEFGRSYDSERSGADLQRLVDFDEFVDAARALMYDQLLPRGTEETKRPAYGVVDFSESKCASGEAVCATRDFLVASRKPDWARTRWIEARGGATALKVLGVKFGLHPLALEDALTVSQRPKAERYSGHLHIVAPVFTVGADENYSSPTISIHNVSIFVPLRGGDTLVTFSSAAAPRHWSARVRAELRKSYTKLREEGAPFLAYRILDAVVDSTFPVAAAFHQAVAIQRHTLREGNYHSDLSVLRSLKLDLERLTRIARPLHRLLTKLIDDQAALEGDRYDTYVRDAVDNVEELQDDFNALLKECEVLFDEFERFHQRRMDRTIYALTVVTCVFLPMQFVTGVYGMNFRYMPELHNEMAYFVFWVAVTSYVGLFIVVLAARELVRKCACLRKPSRPLGPAELADDMMHIPIRSSMQDASRQVESPNTFKFFKRFLPTASNPNLSELNDAHHAARGRDDSDLGDPLMRNSRLSHRPSGNSIVTIV